MGMLGFGTRKTETASDDAQTYEWARPARDRGLGYEPERAAAAVKSLESIMPLEPALAGVEHVRELPDAETARIERVRKPAPDGAIPSAAPWLRELSEPGAYWHCGTPGDYESLSIVQVLQIGNQLTVAHRRPGSDSVTYLSVGRVGGYWAGPLPIPEGVELRQISLPLP